MPAMRILVFSSLVWLMSSGLWAADLMQAWRDAALQDPQLMAEQARFEQAKARVAQTSADLLPQIELSGRFTHTDRDGAPDAFENFNTSLTARQLLFDGRVWYARQAETQALKSVAAQLQNAQQELLLRVAQAYFEVLKAEDNLRSAGAEEEAIERQLGQAKEQHEVGLIAITGVLEAQAAYDAARAARIGAEGALIISYDGLEQITGQQYDALHTLRADYPVEPPQPSDRQYWIDLALDQNLSLQALAARTAVAEQAVSARRAGHWPSVGLFAEHSRNSETLAGPEEQTVLGVQASLELYGGGRTSAQVRESSFALEEARAGQDQTRREVIQQTRSLFTQMSTDVLGVQARAQAIRSAESALQATRTGYEVGTRNLVELLNAERALWAARRDYDAARYQYVLSQLGLLRVTGQLAVDDLQSLNDWLVASQDQ